MKEIEITENNGFSILNMDLTNNGNLYIDIDRLDPDGMYPDQSSYIEISKENIQQLKDFINSL